MPTGLNGTYCKVTYRFDLLRSAFGGIIEFGVLTFGLLVAIRYFQAPNFLKGALSSGMAIGFLLSPYLIKPLSITGQRVSHVAAICLLGSSFGYAMTSLSTSLLMFVTFYLVATILVAQLPGLLIKIYSRNYSHAHRGSLVSNSLIIAAITGAPISLLGGAYLDHYSDSFGMIFVVMAVCSLVCAYAVYRMPSSIIQIAPKIQTAKLNLLREDKLFARMLAGWMLLGLGNLALIPLRIEILANPKYGFNLSNEMIILFTVVIFSLARIVGLKLFGWLFERMNFLVYRNVINLLLCASILLYFNFHNLWFIAAGSALFGLALGGGNLAWSLWVTRIAPTEKVSEYMTLHMKHTGYRGVLAPLFGYTALPYVSPQFISWVSIGFLILSIAIFLQIWKEPRMRKLFDGRA